VALEAIARIESSPMLERGQVKEYHIEVSEVLRTYVEARFCVPSLEMTTREVVDGLRGVGAPGQFVDGLRRFLDQCDMVKFAKVRPTLEASQEILGLGRDLVTGSVPDHADVVSDTGGSENGGSDVVGTLSVETDRVRPAADSETAEAEPSSSPEQVVS
jgi:hypothetical protein